MPADRFAATDAAPAPQAHWNLNRRHALTPRQFGCCMAAPALLLGLFGWGAIAVGYWPVAIFCGIQLLALALAFLHYAVHAMDGEQVLLHPSGELEIRSVHGWSETRTRLPAAWARVEHARGARPPLRICCGRTRIGVGRHIPPGRAERLHQELRAALCEKQWPRAATGPALPQP